MEKTNILTSFSITGDIVPDEVTNILGLNPTKIVNKGEFRIGKLASWELFVDYTDTIELDTQLKKLIINTGLINKVNELTSLQETSDVIIRLNVCININTINPKEKPVIWIDPKISNFVGALGVSIDIDTYYD
ncbi:DUF4279 domain-containing protein [Breznakia sp. OttesenSCG-928-G09]|nr:DUF4279 domain-containing protein [Breznakia sp. OttesenSCG-928-G09]